MICRKNTFTVYVPMGIGDVWSNALASLQGPQLSDVVTSPRFRPPPQRAVTVMIFLSVLRWCLGHSLGRNCAWSMSTAATAALQVLEVHHIVEIEA